MSKTTINDAPLSNEKSTTTARPPMVRAATMPNTPTSPLATNPWYQQKFEQVCHAIDVISHFFVNIIFVRSIAM